MPPAEVAVALLSLATAPRPGSSDGRPAAARQTSGS